MDAAASTIVHRYRRFLFPSPRPIPLVLLRPLGPLLPLLTVGDLLFSKKNIPIRVISVALTPSRHVNVSCTRDKIATFRIAFPLPFSFYTFEIGRFYARNEVHNSAASSTIYSRDPTWTSSIMNSFTFRFSIFNLLIILLL